MKPNHTRLLISATLTALLWGCSAAAGGGGLFIALLSMLLLAACIEDPATATGEDAEPTDAEPTDAGPTDAGPTDAAPDLAPTDARPDAAPDYHFFPGGYEVCCEGGMISTCYCPPDTACNYGWYTECGDGTCAYDECPRDEDPPVDAGLYDGGPPDAEPDAEPDASGGYYEPCCTNGVITTCWCPPDTACNYGWFEHCGDDTCVSLDQPCPEDADGGP